MADRINARSVIKTVTTTQAWARRDSDAFILPDYIHGCAFRSHHGHTHDSISARSPLGPVLLLFFWKRVPVESFFCDWLIYSFFLSGGVTNWGWSIYQAHAYGFPVPALNFPSLS